MYDSYAKPGVSLKLRLAAMEAITQLRVRENGANDGGPQKGLEWVLNVIEREEGQGCLALKYKALQVLFHKRTDMTTNNRFPRMS